MINTQCGFEGEINTHMSAAYGTRKHHDLTFKESKAFKRFKVFIQIGP